MLDVETIPIFSLIVQNDSHIFECNEDLDQLLIVWRGLSFPPTSLPKSNRTIHWTFFIQTVTELHISLLNLIWYVYTSQLKNSVKKAESSTIYQLISLGYSQWQMHYLGDRLTRFSVSVETGFRRSRKLRTPRRAAPDRPMNSLVRSASVMSVLPFSTK